MPLADLIPLSSMLLVIAIGCGLHAVPAGETPVTTITVGSEGADILGTDSLAIQKAIDQVLAKAPTGGGVVAIKAGTYTMYNSLIPRGPVTIRGAGPTTILKKAPQYITATAGSLAAGAVEVELKDIGPIKPGWGITFFRPGAWAASIRSVVAVTGNRITIDRPRNQEAIGPQGDLGSGTRVQTSFPLVQLISVEGVVIEDMILDGNLAENADMDVEGCRNGGIYMCSVAGKPGRHTVRRCVVRNYAGEGISWQGPTDVTIDHVESCGNKGSGMHPGTGGARAVVLNSHFHHNQGNGIYICWDVTHSRFEDNIIEHNGRCGISTGHGDSDTLFLRNTFRGNKFQGVLFRRQQPPPDRLTFRENIFEDNAMGVKVDGNVPNTVFERNIFRDTRKDPAQKTQKVAILSTLPITFTDNTVDGEATIPKGK